MRIVTTETTVSTGAALCHAATHSGKAVGAARCGSAHRGGAAPTASWGVGRRRSHRGAATRVGGLGGAEERNSRLGAEPDGRVEPRSGLLPSFRAREEG